MLKLDSIADKAAFPISGALIIIPPSAPSAEQYAHTINMMVLPTLGVLIGLFQLSIMVRKWWRGRKRHDVV